MKKQFLSLMALLVATAFTACSNDGDELAEPNNAVVLSAGIDNDAKTRTLLGNDTGEAGTSADIYWSDDTSDAFSIEVGGTPYTFTKRETTTNSATAKFGCDNAPTLTAGTYTAKYPAAEITSYAEQTGTKADLKNYHYMEASFTVTDGQTWNDVAALEFATKVAIVKLTLSNEDFKGQSVTDVTLKANDAAVVKATYTFTGDATDGSIVAYLAIPSTSFALTNIVLSATCGDTKYTAALGDKTLEAGKLYRVSKTMDKVVPVVATDLSPLVAGETDKYQTANCYIVTGAGSYKFRATHKGNSNASEHALTIDHVAVLWESFGTSTTPSVGDLVKDAEYSDSYISFTASDKKGNAVIAAYNSDDEIVWSWHIWMTDKPEEHIYVNSSGTEVGTAMDRNLGATSATPSDGTATYGLFYQWGRKDPFLGACTTSGYKQDGKAASTGSWTFAANTSETGTVEYSIKNPTYFLGRASGANGWCWTDQGNLWDTTKTIYDPSPYGWKVPTTTFCSGFKSSAYTVDDTNKGITITNNNNTLWYPYAGVLGGNQYGAGYGGLNSVSSSGYYKTSVGGTNYMCGGSQSNKSWQKVTNQILAAGNSIRCMKE